jgi:dihydropteroate synthase
MGILNVTPDSFSDGGQFLSARRAVAHALRMQREGADLIDVGGESTRPGARPVPAREEMRRILPIIEQLAGRLKIPISVDTSKAAVAEAALRAGASLVNDVTALGDPAMGRVVSRAGVPVILMHTRGTPLTMKSKARYRKLIPEVLLELQRSVRKALAAGIRRKNILIDPGIGFAKSAPQSLELIRRLTEFKKLGFPVVAGPSRKSFIGLALGDLGGDRLLGTAAAVALCAANGADMIRVHDVAAMRQAALVGGAIGARS